MKHDLPQLWSAYTVANSSRSIKYGRIHILNTSLVMWPSLTDEKHIDVI